MQEYIGKVKLNLEHYSGLDLYSDGEIEEELLSLVKNEDDYTTILSQEKRWPFLYHLSSIRENLVEWIPISKEDNLLEIGSGCGALTGIFSKKANAVVSIELSKRRSEINAYKNRFNDNIEIIVGNLNEIKLSKQFDFITLIGVLEYAGTYTKTQEPYRDFLNNISKYLKTNGKLIIAIENKFGLKYWAGCREDHTGNLFDSIEGYKIGSPVRTFSKEEIKSLLQSVGYQKLDFYYPTPDYKLPFHVFSDSYLPKVGEMRNLTHNYDQTRLDLFDEGIVYDQLIESNQFGLFANSFLIIAQR